MSTYFALEAQIQALADKHGDKLYEEIERSRMRAKTKSVSADGLKHAMAPEHIALRACVDGNDQRQYKIKDVEKFDAISLEIAHCAAFMGRNEAIQFAVSVVHKGSRQWGSDFTKEVQQWLEGLDG